MADNIAYTEGSGRTIATDETGGVDYQLIKLVNSTADSTTRTGVAADPLVVGDGGGSLTVDAASLPLPTGASTAAKQAALGTAGSASADVLSVQGVASMTALTVAGVAAADAAVAGNPVLEAGRASTVLPTAVSADGDVVTLWADRNGALVTTPRFGATSTLANVAGSASSVTLIASNTSRRSAVIVNDSTAILYVKEGATASATSFTYRLQAYDTLILDGAYSGTVDGIWASATGNARVTERT